MAAARIDKWGNSIGALPQIALDTAESDTVEAQPGTDRKASRRRSIKEIFDRFEGSYEREAYDWGKPMGDEAW
jgi:antitoxin component of MazEF toxin-antitoxin module